jgi:Fe-S-cluster-containing dehydrogenase component
MPSTEWNYYNLIKFAEDERDGNLMWLMRKDQCMHCEDPGCLRACPADGAIIKYENGIVDFQQENCIGCGYCISGCPFDIPKFHPKTKKVYKCTLCSDRVGQGLEPACIKACPTGCLQFGTKSDMVQIARACAQSSCANNRALPTRAFTIRNQLAARTSSTCLHDIKRPERYGLPANPNSSKLYRLEMAGETDRFADGRSRNRCRLLPSRFLWTEVAAAGTTGNQNWPREEIDRRRKETAMSSTAKNFDEKARGNSLSRHHASSSWRSPAASGLHAFPALVGSDLFVLSLLTGFAIYSPWLYRWIAPLFGGGPRTRVLHPWFGLLFEVFFFFSFSIGLRRWSGQRADRDS